MRLGYSMLLGEHISAEGLQHKDCELFQIVCPACREPVFKGERDREDDIIHYLSHYTADKSYVADCELRVKGLTDSEVKNADGVSRGQRLEFFLQVLRNLIGRDPIYGGGIDKAQRFLNKSAVLRQLRNIEFEGLRKQGLLCDELSFHEAAQGYLADITGVGGRLETAYSIAVKERIARDVWRHLLSPKGKPNFEFLFNHGYIALLSRMGRAADLRALGRDERDLYLALDRLPQVGKEEAGRLAGRMADTPVGPPFAMEGSTMLSKAFTEIIHEMIGALISLPYLDALRNKAGA